MSEYLDAAGVEKIWQKVKDRSVPVKTLTQAQYDALSYEERTKDILYVTNPLGTPSSAPASDVPIGAVIAVMGKTAPKDYLICDGAEHSIEAYPDLAAYFTEQFGTVNHFGGDGTTTFAVPDLRNLFLRGYHGEASEQLSGEIGEKQEATEIPGIVTGYNGTSVGIYPMASANGSLGHKVSNPDKVVSTTSTFGATSGKTTAVNDFTGNISSYTSRPVNTAVLYCIKAVNSEPKIDEYDTEDGWHVRKWRDGYVEMNYASELIAPSFIIWTSNIYRARIKNLMKLPLTLTKKYFDGTSISNFESAAGWLTPAPFTGNELEYTSPFFVCAPASIPESRVKFMVHVTGRWK